MFWNSLPEHNPTKLDSTQNLIPTANGDFPKINYTQCHFNYYYRVTLPKIVKPASQTSQYHIASPKNVITAIQCTKLKIWIFD
jgi:hypothetical protein